MTISNEAFAALQAAVGARYVSKDVAIRSSNGWNRSVGKNDRLPTLPHDNDLPIAVVLPSTVEEVAAVVKACNRHGLYFKALSMGWGNMGGATRPNTVSIDLRRMDHCEIDAKNQMAVIGPYVSAGRLMADAMKHGLTTHVVGAGPTHSPLASATSAWGIGISGATTGFNGRNLLSLEWVTPEGEIVRIGSSGSGRGWFTSDGPGPSFRGMIRGLMGSMGGLGVFTRIGYRLHPWHGPRELEFTGRHPQIGMKLEGTRMRYYQAVWPTWEGMTAAAMEFNVAAVTTVQLRMPPENIGWTLSATNNEYLQWNNTHELPAAARQENSCSWSILTTAYSDKQDVYNDKVVRLIVERTGGKIIEVEQDHTEVLARALATSCYVPRVLRPSTSLATTFGLMESWHILPRTIRATEDVYADAHLSKDYFHSLGPEQNWVWPTERRTVWTENILVGNAAVEHVGGALMEGMLYCDHLVDKRRLGNSAFMLGPALDLAGPRHGPHSDAYMRRVKNTFDPKNLSDPFLAIGAKPMPVGAPYRALVSTLFKPAFRGVMRQLARRMSAPPTKKNKG